MILVYFCSTCSLVELKTRFDTWITRNDLNVVIWSNFILIILLAYLCSQKTPYVQIKYFIFDWSIYILFVLNRGWKHDPPNNDMRICLLDILPSWTKNAFSDVNNKKWNKRCKFVLPFSYNNTYGLPVTTMDTKCPNQVFLLFDWSIYRLCVLNTGWKPHSLQLTIFVSVCSTWNKVEQKTRFETWITRNVVNGVNLFHLYYLKTLMAYL
jgi:hypothetical protein